MTPTLSVVSSWLEVLKGLLTPLIAVVATYIAWQQWRANKLKLVLDRYDRRLRVYQRVVEFLRTVTVRLDPDPNDIVRFAIDASEADFLFGPEIPVFIKELVDQALALHVAKTEYRDFTQEPPPGYDHKKVVDQMHRLSAWFAKQPDAAKEKFREYLDVSK